MSINISVSVNSCALFNLSNVYPVSINALDLVGNKISKADIVKSEEMIKLNFGINYPPEKFSLLWTLILEEGWTDYRLKETVKYFLKTKKYPNWTIADWFDYSVKLYNYSAYQKELMTNSKLNEQIEWYKISIPDNKYIISWKYIDGHNLPFQKLNISHNHSS